MQIYLARNNVQAGPYDLDQLNIMLTSGEVTLDDLVWHEGLDQWQRIGNLTHNQKVYRPAPTVSTTNTSDDDSIINNVTVFPEDSDSNGGQNDKAVSLDRLYGNPERPKGKPNKAKTDMTTNRQYSPSNVSLNKSNAVKSASAKDVVIGNVVLAPIMSRVLATTINSVLYLLAVLPLILAWLRLDVDYTKFQNIQNMESFNKALEYYTTLIQSLPTSTLMMSQALIFGLLALQFVFIVLRGQSLGKLITGIRVVDQTTHRLPSFTKLVAVRTLLLFIIYYLVFSLLSIFGLIVVAIHYYMASKNPQNIGWHDKLAKTLVVKADKEQLVKPSKLN